jgi:hypothetical protein
VGLAKVLYGGVLDKNNPDLNVSTIKFFIGKGGALAPIHFKQIPLDQRSKGMAK